MTSWHYQCLAGPGGEPKCSPPLPPYSSLFQSTRASFFITESPIVLRDSTIGMTLYKPLAYCDESHRHPPAANNYAIAHIRTAALLGTPSKTLLSGTPELVRGLGRFLPCCYSGLPVVSFLKAAKPIERPQHFNELTFHWILPNRTYRQSLNPPFHPRRETFVGSERHKSQY
jgi:hypothetical protein